MDSNTFGSTSSVEKISWATSTMAKEDNSEPNTDWPDLGETKKHGKSKNLTERALTFEFSGQHGADSGSNERSFHSKLSNKVRKKLKNDFTLDAFLKVRKTKKPDPLRHISEKTLTKILETNIVQHRGKKRHSGKKISTAKKNILKIRKEREDERLQAVLKAMEQTSLTDERPDCPKKTVQTISEERLVRHSRSYRSYCDNLTPESLETSAATFIRKLFQFQDKAYQKNPEKYKKRFVLGLKDAKRFLELKQSKCLIIATDLEPSSGGLDEQIEALKTLATLENIPVVFVFRRRKLAHLLMKKTPISCLTVLNYESAEEFYTALVDELKVQKDLYKNSKIVQQS